MVYRMLRHGVLVPSLATALLGLSIRGEAAADDWNRFRGPNGTGVASDTAATPSQWSPDKNIRWKVALPGAGVSCPIVVGDKVLVTCYSGYGESRQNVGDMKDLTRHLVCLDKQSGEILWQKSLPATVAEDPYAGAGVPQHGYASHTPTSDGEHVYVFFGKAGVLAFDLDGNQLWQTSVGTDSDPMRWGSSSSPIVHENLLVVPAGAESRAVVGLDKKTGKELWRADAEGLGMVWGTPAIVNSQGKSEIVIGAPYEVWSLNPENGKLSWYCEANNDDQFSSSVVVDDQVVYAVGGRGGGSIAVKAGGSDDVAKTHVVWKGQDSTRFATPIVYQNRLYHISSGIVTCLDSRTGKEIFKGRLRTPTAEVAENAPRQPESNGPPNRGRGGFGGGGMGGSDYASPVIADGKLYYLSRSGDMHVLEAGTQFNQLAVNRVTQEAEDFSATPAISDGQLFIRSNKHLYCVGSE